MESKFEVVIIGAGLSGLSAARTLLDCCKTDFVVLEKSSQPGGRVRTLEKDGFRLDAGFQVGLNSYPAFHSILRWRSLQPCCFGSGALVEEVPGKLRCLANPLRHPLKAGNAIFSRLPLFDRIRLLNLAASCVFQSDERLLQPVGMTSMDWLKKKGFSRRIVDAFFRPFFGGVFLDDKLRTDASLLRYYLKKFTTGRAFVPRGGMGNMGRVLADSIPAEHIRYRTGVEKVASGESGSIIELENGDKIHARKVIVATDPATFAKFCGWETAPEFCSTKVVYFKSPTLVYEGKWIVLPSSENRVTRHFVQLTNIDPSLAPGKQALLSATILDDRGLNDASLADAVKAEIAALFPDTAKTLELVDVVSVRHALPVQSPDAMNSYSAHSLPAGVIPAGDLVSNASLQNALESGKNAALQALGRL